MKLQKITTKKEDDFGVAIIYYNVIAIMNNLSLTQREIELVAFTALKGNINYKTFKEEFCKKFNTSEATIYNMASKLRKLGVLYRDNEGKTKINPNINTDFKSDVSFLISIEHA